MALQYEIEFYGHHPGDGAEYDVTVDGEPFETWVTHDPYKVENWIRDTENWNHRRLHRLIVGLDIEWRPNTVSGQSNPVAILQLFVSRRCLIYQFRGVSHVPKVLKNFLKNTKYTFVGVGIEEDKRKLLRDHSLEVTRTMDLREWAVREYYDRDVVRNAGLKKLAKVILGKDVNHGEVLRVRMSNWESEPLSNEQVLYACLDGYLSFAIGRQLQSWYD